MKSQETRQISHVDLRTLFPVRLCLIDCLSYFEELVNLLLSEQISGLVAKNDFVILLSEVIEIYFSESV